MAPMLRVVMGLWAWFTLAGLIRAQDVALAPSSPTSQQVRQWVAALESDTYSVRLNATEKLILAGGDAVEPVAQAIEQGGLETIIRGVHVLRQLAIAADDLDTQAAAYRALQKIAERRLTMASRRAASALQSLDEVRYRRALQYLQQQGAVVSLTQVRVGARQSGTFPSILIGQGWRGREEDLDRLESLAKYRRTDEPQKWMVDLQGNGVTDSWIERIKTLGNVAVVRVRSTRVTDAAIGALKEMPDLQVLQVMYTPLTDGVVPHLESLKNLVHIELYGTQLSPTAASRLREHLVGVDVDIRQGGFLGIGCEDNPCRILTIRPGTAAATAGLQIGDVLTHYNDHPVKTMDELTALISQNAAGDKVQLVVLRGEQRLVKEVVLGQWD